MRLARDTLREASYQTLMRLYGRAGDRAGALRTYERCADILRRELDVEPGPATRRVRDSVLKVEAASEPDRPSPAPPPVVSTREIPLIGRETELQQLQAVWRRAAAGHPSLVIVTGEAGIGKTRLLEELLDRAASEDGAC